MVSILFISLIFGLEGLVIGSFLNVVIDRHTLGKSLGGRSSCDICRRKLSPRELIPVLSYLIQGGRSLCCKKKLKLQYSFVEALTGLFFFTITYFFLSQSRVVDLTLFLSLVAILGAVSASIAISLIDFRHHIIPDGLQIVLFGCVLFYLVVSGGFQVKLFGEALVVALPILLLYLVTGGRGMGYGDIKLQVTLGLWLGLAQGFLGLYISFITGAVYGIILILRKSANKKSHVAFGPFLLLGAWIAFFMGDSIIRILQGFLF